MSEILAKGVRYAAERDKTLTPQFVDLLNRAANLLEKHDALVAENARLREALQDILNQTSGLEYPSMAEDDVAELARAALNP